VCMLVYACVYARLFLFNFNMGLEENLEFGLHNAQCDMVFMPVTVVIIAAPKAHFYLIWGSGILCKV